MIPHAGRCLHCDPPLTPAGFFAGRRPVLVGLGVLFLVLAVAAWESGGALLLTWDDPIQRAVEASRTSLLDSLFRRVSFLGSTNVPAIELAEKLAGRVPPRTLTRTFYSDDGSTAVEVAKACRHLHIPMPPQGYWTEKDAGLPVSAPPMLPPLPASVPKHQADERSS